MSSLTPFSKTPPWLRASLVALLVATGACTDDVPGNTDTDTDTDTTTGDVTTVGPTTVGPTTVDPDTSDTTQGETTEGDTTEGDTTEGDTTTGPVCGDGTVDDGEECDGDALDGATCQRQGFASGTLACAIDCTFDTRDCVSAVCGNDEAETGETCDGTDLAGQTCVLQGFTGGVLACAGDCGGFDTSGCLVPSDCCAAKVTPGCNDADCQASICAVDPFCCDTEWDQICADAATGTCLVCGGVPPVCGDGVASAGESCDGADLAGLTCQSLGFAGGGVLACDAGCTFDTTGCIVAGAGDCCLPNGSPGCIDEVCQTSICAIDPFCCDTEWDQICADAATGLDGGGLMCAGCGGGVCGNDVVEPGESCDGANLNGQTCATLGFAGGGVLACGAGCTFDTTGCIAAGAGNCCIPNGTPGCSDAVCQASICAFDPFCCDTEWDDICANTATGVDGAGLACAVCGP